MDHQQFVAELGKLRTSSTFLTLKGYRSESGEVSDFSIVFHISYKNALLRSIAKLEALVPADELEAQAKEECLSSFMESLDRIQSTPIEEADDTYRHFTDSNGTYIKGVKLHEETNTLHLYGLVVHKKVLMPGLHKTKNRKPLTAAKNRLRRMCPVGSFRQFKINPDQLDSISVENLFFFPPEE